MVGGGTTHGASDFNARVAARKKKITWSVDQLDMELSWRRWFPQTSVDWSHDLSAEDADILFAACVSFMQDNLHIKVPGKGRIPFQLREAQLEVLYQWIRYRRTVSLKARQVGFSTLSAAFVLWQGFGWSDRLIVMLSRTERESIKLLAKVKYNYKSLPDWVRLRGPQILDRTKQVMTFDNESVIESLPSANDPARGESVFLVVVDEWAFLPNPDEAWASIEPITDIGGRVIGISTANGEGNFFHNLWLGSQMGTNGFKGIFHPWSAVDGRDDEWYAQKLGLMQSWQIAQEYPTTPDEAFVGSGNPVFNLDVIRSFVPKTPEWQGQIEVGGGKKTFQMFEGDTSSPFMVWDTPNDTDKWSYVIGVDIAQGESYGDFTVAQVLCVQSNEIVAVWLGKADPDVFGETILPSIGWYYRNAVIAPEINNHGLTTLKGLQRAGYNRIYMRHSVTKRTDRALESVGWLTTHTSKPLMIDELAGYLRDAPTIRHDRTIQELRAYRRNTNGKMSGSPHDDCVMSLAIAVQARKYAITERVGVDDDPAKIKGSFAWWEKALKNKKVGSTGLKPVI